MPYNSEAIPPREEIIGAATLPLARVKKILAADEDIGQVSANAAFAITIATEMFIRYFADQAMNVVKSERKPRRTIQYKDLANAVSRIDNLTFLEDVVPKTTTYREFKARNKGRGAKSQEGGAPLPNGQTTIDASANRTLAQRPAGRRRSSPIEIVDEPSRPSVEEEEEEEEEGAEEGRAGVSGSPGQPHMANGQQLIFEHYEPNGSVRRDESGDVEMG